MIKWVLAFGLSNLLGIDDGSLQRDLQVAWSKCRQPLDAVLHSRNDCQDDLSTINIFLSSIIINIIYIITEKFPTLYLNQSQHK